LRFKNKKCFILDDIKGTEKFMLEVASSLLNAEPKPIWMVEIYITENQPEGVKINHNFLRLILRDEVEIITKNYTKGTQNFLFIEKDKKMGLLGS